MYQVYLLAVRGSREVDDQAGIKEIDYIMQLLMGMELGK
jgi:hypothetical protein